jgi:hypothetical protein
MEILGGQMITIRSITVHDGKLTEAGEDFCATLWEHPAFAIEGKPRCWHRLIKEIEEKNWEGQPNGIYEKTCSCGKQAGGWYRGTNICANPDLLHDLNAVHELESLFEKRICDNCVYYPPVPNAVLCYTSIIDKIYSGKSLFLLLTAPAHIRLEALATVLDAECGECGGSGHTSEIIGGVENNEWVGSGEHCESNCSAPKDSYCAGCMDCPTCSGTRRVPIIDQWAAKWRGR